VSTVTPAIDTISIGQLVGQEVKTNITQVQPKPEAQADPIQAILSQMEDLKKQLLVAQIDAEKAKQTAAKPQPVAAQPAKKTVVIVPQNLTPEQVQAYDFYLLEAIELIRPKGPDKFKKNGEPYGAIAGNITKYFRNSGMPEEKILWMIHSGLQRGVISDGGFSDPDGSWRKTYLPAALAKPKTQGIVPDASKAAEMKAKMGF